jgi:hypothetical protein
MNRTNVPLKLPACEYARMVFYLIVQLDELYPPFTSYFFDVNVVSGKEIMCVHTNENVGVCTHNSGDNELNNMIFRFPTLNERIYA